MDKEFKVIVKPRSSKNEFYLDKEKNVYVARIKATAEKGKANKELIKFLGKELNKRVEIVKGLKSREKIIRLL